jgi:predicted dienelactone hydrolase
MRIFKNRIVRVLARIVVSVVVTAIAGIALLLLVLWLEHKSSITLPAPSGNYAVGRVEFDWVDPQRIDWLAPAPGTHREITVWIWYPADGSAGGAAAAEYQPAPLRNASEQEQGVVMCDLLTRDLRKVHCHAIESAPFAPGRDKFPVVLFKPGIGALATDYTTLCEDLASHGYVVAASDSPYSTFVVVFHDGRIVKRTSDGNPGERLDEREGRKLAEKLIPVWSGDLQFELDQLEQLNKQDPANRFTGRLNLDETGAFGHSFGGATAAQFCHDDRRCKAAIDIDGQPFGDVVQTGVGKPFLLLEADHTGEPGFDEISARINSMMSSVGNWPNQIRIHGARHFNFSDTALLKERHISKWIGFLGPIDERRALAITSDYIRAFFDAELKNSPDDLMRGPSAKYPEVEINPR